MVIDHYFRFPDVRRGVIDERERRIIEGEVRITPDGVVEPTFSEYSPEDWERRHGIRF